MLERLLTPLIIAFQLLTRIPTPQITHITAKQLGESLLFYPLVGSVIGALLLLLGWLLSGVSIEVVAAMILISWVIITGALHIDGLGDSADAWIGGYGDPQRTLEIMKDPYCGPAAVSSIVLLMIAKYAALQPILEGAHYWVLFIAPFLSRTFILLLFLTTPYVRQDGIGASLAQHLPTRYAWGIFLACSVLLLLLLQWIGLLMLICAVIAFFALRYWMIQRIGGTTGDTAGAMIEILELVLLLSFVLFITSVR